ncbi:DNA repair protein rad5 [Rhypophila decipiens]
MDLPYNEEPPSKRRRFFDDLDQDPAQISSPVAPSSSIGIAQSPAPSSPIPTRPVPRDGSHQQVQTSNDDATSTIRSPLLERDVDNSVNRKSSTVSTGFDQDTFESFVGTKVAPNVLDLIRGACGDNIERAVNMYFDGTWKSIKKKAPLPSRPRPTAPGSTRQEQDQNRSFLDTFPHHKSTPESRYIGAFGAEAYATCSGTNLLKYGDAVLIVRQKPTVPQSSGTRARPRTVNTIVRFTTTSGKELGRLTTESTSWMSPLMDQKVCKFEGTCVYAPDQLRTNETVYLQIRCSLLRSAFDGRGFQLADNRTTGFFEEKETAEEMDLRLRQVALVKLLQQVNLLHVRANAAAAGSQRKELLAAAELAEKEKEKSEKKKGNAPSSSDSDENEDGKELEQDQLDALYKKAQTFDFNTPQAEPAGTFAMTLRPYQKQSLYWMMAKEKDQKDKQRERSMHPLWEEYSFPIKDHDGKDLPIVPDQPSFYLNPYSGDISLEFPQQEQHCLGGILADEMGLGKTIQMLSLVHSHRSDVALQARHPATGTDAASINDLPRLPTITGRTGVVDAPCTTLVVAPMSLLAQWQSEAARASKEGTLRSIVYYGPDKNLDLPALCCEANAANAPDVIITSYGIVLSEFGQLVSRNMDKANSRGLFSLNFFRIILDEAHNIKNRQSKTAKACFELTAEHRWVLTGTPIVNRLEDLFSLVRFLRVEPWNNFSFWRTFITVPFETKDFMRALDVVQSVLEPLVMRRTKDMKTPSGELLVPLPPKEVNIVDIELSKPERDVYEHVFARARRTFNANVEAGTVMKSYTSIFAQILRLRQTCCHPILVRHQEFVADEMEEKAAADAAAGLADDMDLQSLIERFTATTEDANDENRFGAHVLAQIRDEAIHECPICAEEPMINQTVTGCWHSACRECLLDYIKHQIDRHEPPRCFQCREPVNQRDLFEVVRQDDDPDAELSGKGPRISLQRLGVNHSSAKVVALIKHLRDLRRENPTIKSVVFSQFTSFLSLLEPALAMANMRFLRLDGSMAQKARAAVLEEFKESKKFTVLLISLKAGGVGLNLTSAKRVFMMDPWWSFAVEAQAIDRVHRMGQEDEVKVYRFIVKNSVEERMLKIQDRKKFIATSLGMMSDEEKKMQRIEDIRELLS